MPKKIAPLSAAAVKNLKKDGRHSVGGCDGLHLFIRGASRVWVFRGRMKNQPKSFDLGLGSYPEIGLAEARETALQVRREIRAGIDPREQRRQDRIARQPAAVNSFRECALATVESKSASFENVKHIAQWASTLETYAFPALAELDVSTITSDQVAAALKPIWQTVPETASRTLGRIRAVFDYASARGLRTLQNPADKKLIETILGPQAVEEANHAALPYAGVPDFWLQLRASKGTAARALQFLILTCTRTTEVRGAVWSEIDLTARLWVIPKERMKKKKEHRIPLSDAAMELLLTTPRMLGTDLVFPSVTDDSISMLSDGGMSAVIKRIHSREVKAGRVGLMDPEQNKAATVHGFRSSFRDWSAERTNYEKDVCEHALAHKLPDKVEAAYKRTSYLEKRAGLMNDWANYCTSSVAETVAA